MESPDDYLRSPAGLVSLRTLAGRDLKPGESVTVVIGRMEDGRMYVAHVPKPTGSKRVAARARAELKRLEAEAEEVREEALEVYDLPFFAHKNGTDKAMKAACKAQAHKSGERQLLKRILEEDE